MKYRSALALATLTLLAGVTLPPIVPAIAADVTPERLANPDKEPQNWLMNHRSYDSQRYTPLDKINTGNVKSLKLAYAVALGGTGLNENLEATPLAEDGFLYVVDQWGILYKIDARAGDAGRIVWRMDPKQEKAPDANRGAALWGNFVITIANYPPRVIATNKENGQIAWETNIGDGQKELEFTAAPLAIKDKIIVGAAGGDKGVRNTSFQLRASPAAKPGRTRTTPGRPAAAPYG
jgi:alcohol dehydrogenase (cytochrome c)